MYILQDERNAYIVAQQSAAMGARSRCGEEETEEGRGWSWVTDVLVFIHLRARFPRIRLGGGDTHTAMRDIARTGAHRSRENTHAVLSLSLGPDTTGDTSAFGRPSL